MPASRSPWRAFWTRQWMSTGEAASIVGCTASNIQKLINKGHLEAVRTGHRTLRVSGPSLLEHMAERSEMSVEDFQDAWLRSG